MTRFVVTPDVALRLSREQITLAAGHVLLAPTLFRSQVLALLYRAVADGEFTRAEAGRHLDVIRKLPRRLLGDRVLQDTAWTIAEQLGWRDTLMAEYVALTKLQADALVTLDAEFAREAKRLVDVASWAKLTAR